jgi:hypothetical protein
VKHGDVGAPRPGLITAWPPLRGMPSPSGAHVMPRMINSQTDRCLSAGVGVGAGVGRLLETVGLREDDDLGRRSVAPYSASDHLNDGYSF